MFDAERQAHRLTFRVTHAHAASRVEVSVLKAVAETVQLKPYQRVQVQKILNVADFAIDYVELSFRKQFLQRGNLWRYKEALIGRTLHIGSNANIGSKRDGFATGSTRGYCGT